MSFTSGVKPPVWQTLTVCKKWTKLKLSSVKLFLFSVLSGVRNSAIKCDQLMLLHVTRLFKWSDFQLPPCLLFRLCPFD